MSYNAAILLHLCPAVSSNTHLLQQILHQCSKSYSSKRQAACDAWLLKRVSVASYLHRWSHKQLPSCLATKCLTCNSIAVHSTLCRIDNSFACLLADTALVACLLCLLAVLAHVTWSCLLLSVLVQQLPSLHDLWYISSYQLSSFAKQFPTSCSGQPKSASIMLLLGAHLMTTGERLKCISTSLLPMHDSSQQAIQDLSASLLVFILTASCLVPSC